MGRRAVMMTGVAMFGSGDFCFFGIIWVGTAWICALLASKVGDSKNAGRYAFVCGLLFGPLGLIAALGFDDRPCCPRCAGRVNYGTYIPVAKLCPHCGAELHWEPAQRWFAGWAPKPVQGAGDGHAPVVPPPRGPRYEGPPPPDPPAADFPDPVPPGFNVRTQSVVGYHPAADPGPPPRWR